MPSKAFLCVDDEKEVLISLKTQLKKRFGKSFLYEMAESATEAWEVIDELNEEGVEILIIITDWLMPGIKGDQFLIQVYQKYPEITAIMITGQADENAILRAKCQANLYKCLSKPWDEDELIQTITSAWGRYE